MKKFVAGLMLVLMTVMLITSCTGEKKQTIDENKIYVYYLNSSANGLYPVESSVDEGDTDLMISGLLKEFMTVPIDVDAVRAPADKVELLDCSLSDEILTVYFDSNYAEMSPSRRTLCTAALTYTMTQLAAVQYINIYSGEEPLKDRDGAIMAPFSKADFIDSISDVNAFDRADLTLYFSNETGDVLLQEKRSLMYSMNNSLEKVALTELIKGPLTEGLKRTLPENAVVINVSTNDGICYVTFATNVIEEMAELQSQISVYSIVNTLTELPNVNRVQISFGTEQSETYERNLDITEQTK